MTTDEGSAADDAEPDDDLEPRDDVGPSAATVLRAFLRSRAHLASRTVARDREVIGWLAASMQAYAPSFLDEGAARALEDATTSGGSIIDLVDAYGIVDGIPDFLEAWLPLRMGASAAQIRTAHFEMKMLAHWMFRRDYIEACPARSLFAVLHQMEEVSEARRKQP